MTLRRRMAEFGFESNDDYEFQLRALMEARQTHLRCLAVCGESGRRKTAFAHALGRALDYPHVLYHDFSLPEAPPPRVVVLSADDADGAPVEEPPLPRLDRVLVEACAYSEAARTLLILDQLQAADFRDQVRLAAFVSGHEWPQPSGAVKANPKHLLVLLISEQPLFHSLARLSYRVWTDASAGEFAHAPGDFGLGRDAEPLFAALAQLFGELGRVPTPGELRRVLDDLVARVRTEDHLVHSLYGWIEGLDRARLTAPGLAAARRRVLAVLSEWLGVEEVVLDDRSDAG